MATFKFFYHTTDAFEPEELEFQMQSIPVGSDSYQTAQVLQPLLNVMAIEEPGLVVTPVALHLRRLMDQDLVLSFILSVKDPGSSNVYEVIGCCLVEE